MKRKKEKTKMRKSKGIRTLFLPILLLLTVIFLCGSNLVNAQAAVKTTLKKEDGRLYVYENDKKVCNKWRTIGKYKYYFGKNGVAYQAEKEDGTHSIKIKKIKDKYYAFDINGHMVTGPRVGHTSSMSPEQIYYFNPKTGAYDKNVTARYRAAAKPSTMKKLNSTEAIRKLLGKPQKTRVNKTIGSCFLDGNGRDGELIYEHMIVNVFIPAGSNKEYVESVIMR